MRCDTIELEGNLPVVPLSDSFFGSVIKKIMKTVFFLLHQVHNEYANDLFHKQPNVEFYYRSSHTHKKEIAFIVYQSKGLFFFFIKRVFLCCIPFVKFNVLLSLLSLNYPLFYKKLHTQKDGVFPPQV